MSSVLRVSLFGVWFSRFLVIFKQCNSGRSTYYQGYVCPVCVLFLDEYVDHFFVRLFVIFFLFIPLLSVVDSRSSLHARWNDTFLSLLHMGDMFYRSLSVLFSFRSLALLSLFTMLFIIISHIVLFSVRGE